MPSLSSQLTSAGSWGLYIHFCLFNPPRNSVRRIPTSSLFYTVSTLTCCLRRLLSQLVAQEHCHSFQGQRQFSVTHSWLQERGPRCWLDRTWESHLLCFTGLQQYPPAQWFARGRGQRHTPEARGEGPVDPQRHASPGEVALQPSLLLAIRGPSSFFPCSWPPSPTL